VHSTLVWYMPLTLLNNESFCKFHTKFLEDLPIEAEILIYVLFSSALPIYFLDQDDSDVNQLRLTHNFGNNGKDASKSKKVSETNDCLMWPQWFGRICFQPTRSCPLHVKSTLHHPSSDVPEGRFWVIMIIIRYNVIPTSKRLSNGKKSGNVCNSNFDSLGSNSGRSLLSRWRLNLPGGSFKNRIMSVVENYKGQTNPSLGSLQRQK